jgi:hypothetical protein
MLKPSGGVVSGAPNLSYSGIVDNDLNDAEPQGLHILANQFEPVSG